MPKMKVRDAYLHVEEYGKDNRQSIVYLHGGPGTSCLDFRNQAIKLGEAFHVIIYDQRGVLRSDPIPEDADYGMLEHIKDLDALRQVLNIKKWTLLGHSYGGKLAALYTQHYPNEVESLIYECPSFNLCLSFKSMARYLLSYFKETKDLDGMEKCQVVIEKNYDRKENEVFDDFIKVLTLVNDSTVQNYLHNISSDDMNKIYSSYSDGDIPEDYNEKVCVHSAKITSDNHFFYDYLKVIKDFKGKQLLLCGAFDPVCSKEEQSFYRNNVPNGEIFTFKSSGHFPRLEEPDVFTSVIKNYLL